MRGEHAQLRSDRRPHRGPRSGCGEGLVPSRSEKPRGPDTRRPEFCGPDGRQLWGLQPWKANSQARPEAGCEQARPPRPSGGHAAWAPPAGRRGPGRVARAEPRGARSPFFLSSNSHVLQAERTSLAGLRSVCDRDVPSSSWSQRRHRPASIRRTRVCHAGGLGAPEAEQLRRTFRLTGAGLPGALRPSQAPWGSGGRRPTGPGLGAAGVCAAPAPRPSSSAVPSL